MKILTQLSKRERLIFYVAASIIIFSFLYNFLVEPAYKKYKQLNQRLLSNDIKYQRFVRLTKEKERIAKEYKNSIKDVKLKSSDEEETASLLTQIETIARNSGVRIVDMKPQSTKDRGFYKQFRVEVKVESNMSALTRFMYDTVNSDQILKLERLQINAKGGGSDLLVATINVTKIAVPELAL